ADAASASAVEAETGGSSDRMQPPEPLNRPPARNAEADNCLGGGMVLVVDDTDVVRVAVARMVKQLGFEAVEATDGLDALAKLAAADWRYRIVLMDVMMPRLGGLEALAEIRRTHGDLPVVLMSGYSGAAQPVVPASLRLGAFLQKPFTARELRQA